MAKLILKYEAAVLKEIPLKQAAISIGRTPGNDVVIDNLAVSGHHAKVYYEADKFVLEDLNSLNGTFVNNQRVRKAYLKNGDEVLIGKHSIVFHDEGGPPPEPPRSAADQTMPMAKLEETMVLDTRKRREFLQQATVVAEEGPSALAIERIACLIVLSGKTDQKEYILTSKLAMIGKSPMASVKLKGWFAPDVAAVINKRERSYQIAPSGKSGAKVNGQVVAGPQELKEGDLIEVAGVKMQFNYRE
jgi:pSer/pThr/pTyr-binding forkhead associated (FHA) protein